VDRNLHRYWIRLKAGEAGAREAEFGVTAYTEADALEILRYLAFSPAVFPNLLRLSRMLTSGRLTRAMSSPT
jgi:hypothetical protein